MDDTGLLNARVGRTTQGSRIFLDDLNTGPGTRARGDHQCRAGYTYTHRRLKATNLKSSDLRKDEGTVPEGYKNDAERRACHAAPNLWKTDKVYAGDNPADQESR